MKAGYCAGGSQYLSIDASQKQRHADFPTHPELRHAGESSVRLACSVLTVSMLSSSHASRNMPAEKERCIRRDLDAWLDSDPSPFASITHPAIPLGWKPLKKGKPQIQSPRVRVQPRTHRGLGRWALSKMRGIAKVVILPGRGSRSGSWPEALSCVAS